MDPYGIGICICVSLETDDVPSLPESTCYVRGWSNLYLPYQEQV